ncbi:MAG: GAF domain-containing protein, partial [Anaerolineae bacterium]|nr:GAF domain-containing protein [Anaerolineae bacterium]
MLFTRSLRAKTLLYVIVPAALGLLAVGAIALSAYERIARDLVEQREAELASLQAARLSEGLHQYAGRLQDFARERDVQSMDINRLAVASLQAPEEFKHFEAGVVVFDQQGVAIWITHGIPRRSGSAYPLPSQFDQIRLTRETSLSDIFTDPLTGQELISLAVPIEDRAGQFIGVVAGLQPVGGSSFAQVYAQLLQISPEESKQTYVLDGNGRVVYHSGASRTGSDLSRWAPASLATGGESGALLTTDEAGEQVVSGFAPAPDTGWALVTQQSWNDVVGPIRGYSRILLGVLAIAGLSSGLLLFVSIGRALRPIQDLKQGAQRIAGGDFDYTISASSGDEVQDLAEQFNLMAQALRESYQDLERNVADRTRELAALNAVAEAVSGTLDLDELLHAALDKTLEVVEVEAGGIYLLQEGGASAEQRTLNVAAYKGMSEEFVSAIDNLEVGEGLSGRVVQTGEPLVVPNLDRDPRLTRSTVAESGFRTVAIVPLASRDIVWGSLFVVTRTAREFTAQDVEFLTHIADQIAVAIENAQLYEDTKSRLAQVTALQETTGAVASTLELDPLLNLIIAQATTLLQGDAGIINVVDWESNEDKVVAVTGLPATALEDSAPLEDTLSGWVALHNQPVISNQVQQDSRTNQRALSAVFRQTGRRVRSVVVAPLTSKGLVMGTVVVLDKQGGQGEFDQTDLELLMAFASQAAMAMENARLFHGEQRRAEQFRVISDVSRQMAFILNVDDLLQEIVRSIKETMGYHLVGISLIEGQELVIRAGAGPLFEDPAFQPPGSSVGGPGITGWVAATGEPLLVRDVSQDERYIPLSPQAQTRSELCVPLQTKEAVIGVLNVESDELDAFDESDLAILQSLANQAATAIQNARLFASEQRRAEQFRLLSEVGARITSLLTMDELLDQTVRLVHEVLGYYLVAIGLVEDDQLAFKAAAGPHWDDPDFEHPQVRLGQGISGWVTRTGEPLLVPDVSRDPRYLLLEGSYETKSELAVPLRTKAEIIGVLDVQSDQLNAFDEGDLVVLQSLANLTAIAIKEARLIDAEQRRAEQFRVISEVGASITSILTVDELVQEVVHLVKASLGYYHTAIGLIEDGELVMKAGVGAHWEDPDFKPSRLQVGGEGITAWVASTGQPLLVPDVGQDSRYLQLASPEEIRAEVAVPLKTTTGVIGVLDVQSDQTGGLDESDLAVLESVAHQAAIAIENARLYEQAQHAAALEERGRLARELHDAVT